MDGIFETDYKKKAAIFNTFFAKQCNIDNGSVLPEIVLKSDKRLTDFTFTSLDLSKIINNLNSNKAHGP